MFESFSETARLYAQNYAVIEAVKSEFQRDVDAFLDSVHEEIHLATSGRSRQRITSSYRYWWIGEEDKDAYPQLWVSISAPEIVHPGEVKLVAIAPRAQADQLRALAAVASRPEFSPVCKAEKGGTWSLFTTVIRYEDEPPVQRVSRITASLLLALNEVYESASRAAAASGVLADRVQP